MLKEKAPGANPAPEQSHDINYTTESAPEASFSFFKSTFDSRPAGSMSLTDMYNDIRRGKHKARIEQLRRLKATNPARYSQQKTNLPAVAFGGLFDARRKDGLSMASGLVVIDLDHLKPEELQAVKVSLMADKHTALVFVSPSGDGLKVVFRAEFTDDASFKQAWSAIARYLRAIYILEADETGKDISRLCYLSHDPEAYYNAASALFIYELPEPVARPEPKPIATPLIVGTRDQRYILKVFAMELRRIQDAPAGTGNNSLNISAMKIAQFAYLNLFDKEPIKQHFTEAYLNRGGSHKSRHEADSTFESGWNTGIKSPRALPERGQP